MDNEMKDLKRNMEQVEKMMAKAKVNRVILAKRNAITEKVKVDMKQNMKEVEILKAQADAVQKVMLEKEEMKNLFDQCQREQVSVAEELEVKGRFSQHQGEGAGREGEGLEEGSG